MENLINMRAHLEAKPIEELTVKEYRFLYPEECTEEAMDRKLEEMLEKYGTDEQKARHYKMKALRDETRALGESEEEMARKEEILEEMKRELGPIDLGYGLEEAPA